MLEIHPLTPDRFGDLEDLFGPNGACGGCWCMYFRMSSADWKASGNARNKRLFKARVSKGAPPGLVAYADKMPVGWVQVAPRAETPRFNGPRASSAPVDPKADLAKTWAVTCFFTRARWRGKGITSALLDAAVKFAKAHGARMLEACPFDTKVKDTSSTALYVGVLPIFEHAGFKEIARRLPHRPIVRKILR